MSYTHFTIIERSKIESSYEIGYSIRRIFLILNKTPSSVSRELKRNPTYQSKRIQIDYEPREFNCGVCTKLTSQVKIIIQEKLNQVSSPEQIISRLFKNKLTFKIFIDRFFLTS